MGSDITALLPAVLLSIMVVLTLVLLPHLDKETPHRRYEEPRDQGGSEQLEGNENSTHVPEEQQT